jgi:hypothetical protein
LETLTIKKNPKTWVPENKKISSLWKMEPGIKENGYKERTFVKVRECKFGQMDQCMKDGGKRTRRMEMGG